MTERERAQLRRAIDAARRRRLAEDRVERPPRAPKAGGRVSLLDGLRLPRSRERALLLGRDRTRRYRQRRARSGILAPAG